MMNRLIELYQDLELLRTVLLITDEISGAGYIAHPIDEDNDIVIVRWGSYREGIRILEAYNRADSMSNV